MTAEIQIEERDSVKVLAYQGSKSIQIFQYQAENGEIIVGVTFPDLKSDQVQIRIKDGLASVKLLTVPPKDGFD